MMMSDDIQHPDLVDLGIRLRSRLDRVAEAEQEAAALIARRTASLRDRLLDAEDLEASVAVHTRTGACHRGRLETVATDHLELADGRVTVLVVLDEVAAVVLG